MARVAIVTAAGRGIGAGIAQRTVFQGPKTETTTISVADRAPFVVIDGAVLNSMPGSQTVRAQAEGDVFAAYGRNRRQEGPSAPCSKRRRLAAFAGLQD